MTTEITLPSSAAAPILRAAHEQGTTALAGAVEKDTRKVHTTQGLVEGPPRVGSLREPEPRRRRGSRETPRIRVVMVLLAGLGSWPCGLAHGGVNVWTRHGPEGGTVSALAAAPGHPTRLLAGTTSATSLSSGSLWASPDAAASWLQGLAPGDFNQVRALAFDPSNPAVAYAATSQAGIMRSEDGGDHWIPVLAVSVQDIAVAPSRTTTIYAGSSDGLVFRSDDDAVTWRSVSGGLPTSTSVLSVAVQQDSEQTVYAGTSFSGVFKSTDGGTTWTAASAGMPNAGLVQVLRLAFDLHDPANLLALVGGTTTDPGGLYRSADGGVSWVPVLRQPGLSALALGPRNPSLICLAAGQTVFKSTDDGASWATLVIEAPLNVGITALALDPDDAEVVYAGIGGGPGVLKSADGGMTWAPSGRGLIATSVEALSFDSSPGNTLYALGHIGLFTSPDHGASWASLGEISLCYFPDAIVVDPSYPDTLYVGCSTGAFKSYDGGESWARINHGFDGVAHEVCALAIDPSNPRTLYAGSQRFYDFGRYWGNPLYKTTNGGAAWEVKSSGLPSHSWHVDALVVDSRNPSTVYAGGPGTGTGYPSAQALWRSTNGGRNWVEVSGAGGPPFVSTIAVDPLDPGTIFCTTGGVVYKTTNGGATWTTSFPPSGAASLVLDPVHPFTLYVGGHGGISMSLDGGTTWTLLNGGLNNVHVTALAIERTGTMLHAATDGGGVFDLEISTVTPVISLAPAAATIVAGSSTDLTATIDPPQLTDTQLAASSSDPAVASVPEVVVLPAGEMSVPFTVTGAATSGVAVISVRLPDGLGGASGAVQITVTAGAMHVPRRHLTRSGT